MGSAEKVSWKRVLILAGAIIACLLYTSDAADE